jgi:hypothetical protein
MNLSTLLRAREDARLSPRKRAVLVDLISEHEDLHPYTRLVVRYIIEQLNSQGWAEVSREKIARGTGLSVDSVDRHLGPYLERRRNLGTKADPNWVLRPRERDLGFDRGYRWRKRGRVTEQEASCYDFRRLLEGEECRRRLALLSEESRKNVDLELAEVLIKHQPADRQVFYQREVDARKTELLDCARKQLQAFDRLRELVREMLGNVGFAMDSHGRIRRRERGEYLSEDTGEVLECALA